MNLRNKLIEDAEAFCEATGTSLSTLGKTVANDGKFFARLGAGGDCTTGVYERFQSYFQAEGDHSLPA